MDDFSKRLKSLRLAMGLTQKQFGVLGGVSDVTQGYYESEDASKRKNPGMSYFLNLKENDIDINYLLTGEKVKDVLNARESLLLETFRNGDEQSQNLIIDLCRKLASIPQSHNSSITSTNDDAHCNVNTHGGDYMPKGKKKSSTY